MELDYPRKKKKRRPNPTFVHSFAEVVFGAYVLDALGCLSKQALIDALREGDRLCRSDLVLTVGPKRVVLEYDGGYWHTADRVACDVRKSLKVIANDDSILLVRLRVGGAPPLPALAHVPQCLVVSSDETRPERLMRPLFDSLEPRLALRLRRVGCQVRPEAEKVAHLVLMQVNREYAAGVQRMVAFVGEKNVARVLRIHGIQSRLASNAFWGGIERLRRDWAFDKADLVTFKCDSVAKRLDVCFADSLGRAVRHLDSVGLAGRHLLKSTLSNNAAMLDGLHVLSTKLLTYKIARDAVAFLATFKGSYRHKTAMGIRLRREGLL